MSEGTGKEETNLHNVVFVPSFTLFINKVGFGSFNEEVDDKADYYDH